MELDKPGAGLPTMERLFIKYVLVPTVRLFFTWDIALYLLKREVQIINKMIEPLNTALCQKQIIIDRTFAIEEDSRKFSLNLVLEHLTITGSTLMGLIDTLSKEKTFKQSITIEGVKPHENKTNQLSEFLLFSSKYYKFIDELPKKQSKMTKQHPWFLEFNNFDWAVFMYFHTMIHRRQLQAIIEKLAKQGEDHE